MGRVEDRHTELISRDLQCVNAHASRRISCKQNVGTIGQNDAVSEITYPAIILFRWQDASSPDIDSVRKVARGEVFWPEVVRPNRE